MRDVCIISGGVLRDMERRRGDIRRNIDRLITSYKRSNGFKRTVISLRGVQLICKHVHLVGVFNKIKLYSPGFDSNDYMQINNPTSRSEPTFYVSSKTMDVLKEKGLNRENEIIDAYWEQNLLENQVVVFYFLGESYMVITRETDNIEHHIIREEEYFNYKSMINTERVYIS